MEEDDVKQKLFYRVFKGSTCKSSIKLNGLEMKAGLLIGVSTWKEYFQKLLIQEETTKSKIYYRKDINIDDYQYKYIRQ